MESLWHHRTSGNWPRTDDRRSGGALRHNHLLAEAGFRSSGLARKAAGSRLDRGVRNLVVGLLRNALHLPAKETPPTFANLRHTA